MCFSWISLEAGIFRLTKGQNSLIEVAVCTITQDYISQETAMARLILSPNI